jgi:hypothetical protein
MKKAIIILTLLASNAYASNWIQVSNSVEGTKVSVDTQSINQGQTSDYRNVWMKYSTPVQDELVRYELYCPTKLVRRLHHVTYIKGVNTNSYSGQNIWDNPIPDSIELSAVNVACLLTAK